MKNMTEILRITASIIIGLSSALIFILLGFLFYNHFSGYLGLSILIAFCFLSVFSFYKITTTAYKVGIIKFMSVTRSSPDLDNPVPQNTDRHKILTANELALLYQDEDIKFGGARLRIWGDWKGRELSDLKKIEGLTYKSEEEKLEIKFNGAKSLSVWKPEIIFMAETYIKILKAEKIKWQWKVDTDRKDFNCFEYEVKGSQIKTKNNVGWKNINMFTSLGEPAVMIIMHS